MRKTSIQRMDGIGVSNSGISTYLAISGALQIVRIYDKYRGRAFLRGHRSDSNWATARFGSPSPHSGHPLPGEVGFHSAAPVDEAML